MEAREARGEEKGGVRLFGVTIFGGGPAEDGAGVVVEEDVLRKSKSMGNLSSAVENEAAEKGYHSDGEPRKSRRRRRRPPAVGHERKKGIPWSEQEHRTFLEGLEKLGKGDWRGISRKFVITRTPTQVASHAQKYFIRKMCPDNKKRRTSLFDVVINDNASASETSPMVSSGETHKGPSQVNLPCQDNNKVVAPELMNSGLAASPGPKKAPSFHFMANCVAASETNSFNHMEGVPCFIMKDKPKSVDHKTSQLSSLRLDALQMAVSSKMHTNQITFSQELRFPCRPSESNSLHRVAEGNNLELSIAPPKGPSQNRVGVIRVV